MEKHSFGNIKAQLWPQKKRKTTTRKSKNHSFISVFRSNWSIFIDRFCDRFFTFSRHQTSRHAPAVEAWFITFRLAHKDETRHVFPFLLLCLFLWSAYKIGGVELWMPVLLARNVMNHAPTAHALSYSIDLWFGDFYPYCLQLSKKTFIFRRRRFT